MTYTELGKTGVTVSRLCVGTLTVGPLQCALPVEQGAAVIAHAFERGVNFADTAQYYKNYEYIRRAIHMTRLFDAVISTKTYAYNRRLAEAAFDEARRELDRDYIDIFMLHEQESIHTLRGHMEALDFFFEMKEKGLIRAVGASMHHIAAVEGVTELKRLYNFGVVHPIFNKAGLGICDGDIGGMTAAMRAAKSKGIGIFSMKPLGGGNLCKTAGDALDFVLDSRDNDGNPLCDAVAIGMQSIDECDADIDFFETRSFGEKEDAIKNKTRRLHIEEYCEGCGKCAERCKQNALRVENARAVCDPDKCVLCGYCSAVCPMFAIKVL